MRAILMAAASLACAHVDAEAARRSLLQADADFARDVSARGTAAWAEAFAEDGAMLIANTPLVRGREKIRELMADLGDPGKAKPELQIRWRPLGAQVSDDGTLGWTYGNSVSISARGEHQGKYLTIWRKQADGSWKVQADQGSPGWADPAVAP
jgi:ketosteroid isomerase-like protein